MKTLRKSLLFISLITLFSYDASMCMSNTLLAPIDATTILVKAKIDGQYEKAIKDSNKEEAIQVIEAYINFMKEICHPCKKNHPLFLGRSAEPLCQDILIKLDGLFTKFPGIVNAINNHKHPFLYQTTFNHRMPYAIEIIKLLIKHNVDCAVTMTLCTYQNPADYIIDCYHFLYFTNEDKPTVDARDREILELLKENGTAINNEGLLIIDTGKCTKSHAHDC